VSAATAPDGDSQIVSNVVWRDRPLEWRDVAAVADGAQLRVTESARLRIDTARAIVDTLIARGIPAYGVNTGVGALCNQAVDRPEQRRLSRNLLMSHACGVGRPLDTVQARAIIAAQINNYAHGRSGVRWVVVERLCEFLLRDCVPEVPSRGSVGYLTHMAHIALVLVGEGHARLSGVRMTGAEALIRLGLPPLVLEAKEGLSLVNGTPCVTGLACLALARTERLLEWADIIAAMSFENLGGQSAAFAKEALIMRTSPGLTRVGENFRALLAGSEMLAASQGARLQDALSLRAVPHVHGAARDVFAHVAEVVNRELDSATDNPLVGGTAQAPEVFSGAHAVGAAIGLAMDSLSAAVAEVAAMAERRLDRLLNPMVSGLPPFLSAESGVCSGFMIAQYSAVSLVAENRRLAAPSSLDGGITSALQEDHLSHATPAAASALAIIENAERILGIELLAAAQAYELQPATLARAPGTDAIYRRLRKAVPTYNDDRPLAVDMNAAGQFIRNVSIESASLRHSASGHV
jgi:histidine ammonia-lyase